jgi:uncharacterized protein (DUF2249 family)
MTQPTSAATIDSRTIAPRERHPLIFQTFHGLGDGQTTDIVNDHDPRPLYDQMRFEQPGLFTWDCLHSGLDVWQVHITKRALAHGDARCGGA